jgi:hypothetical protein
MLTRDDSSASFTLWSPSMKLVPLLLLLAAAPAPADTGFIISVLSRVTEVHPSTTVEVWATFEPNLHAFAGAKLDFDASPDTGGLSDPSIPFDDLYGILEPGDVAPDGDSVQAILTAQMACHPNWCPFDTANPILVWQVTWSTTDFTPRTIALATTTTKFDVYINEQGVSDQYLDSLVEGAGLIEVGCYADCDASGALDVFDYLCFINLFESESAEADCDSTGDLDLFDFLCYVNRFSEGC